MITKEYKTLGGMISQSYDEQITFNDFKKGQFYHKTLGWVKFNLPDEEIEKAYDLFARVVYSRVNRTYRLRNYNGHSYGILNRLWLTTKHTDGIRADYCAGQDYVSEIRVIQGIFRNGN